MPNNSVISEGSTTNEAIENGLKILKVSKDMVNVKVLETEKKSFFSILAPRVVKVELTLKDEKELAQISKNDKSKEAYVKKEIKDITPEKLEQAENNVKTFFEAIINKLGNNINYSLEKKPNGLEINLSGDDAGFLIGYRGETMYAFQAIISTIANKGIDEKIRVWLDIEGYKEKREKTLQNLANRIARTVEKTRKSVTLEPMQAYERKIIHSVLQDSKTVKTESIGEEPRRRVVISLK
ncbi:MAG TPA: protein jag [Clostridiales bacterium]|nr:protein jag [Clostridiales bacterium]